MTFLVRSQELSMVRRARQTAADIFEGLDWSSPAWRFFKSRPNGVFVEDVVTHIRETGQPETCPGLYRGALPRNAKYQIVQKVIIDRNKRPELDQAPCPMCTPNRFLNGALVWLPDLQVVSVIGHCCADNADEAEREYKARENLNRQENYLMASLPLIGEKLKTLDSLKGAADDALILFRKLRNKAPSIHRHLRELRDKGNARLVLSEVLRSRENKIGRDYVGPSGFRGAASSDVDSRDVDFGPLAGTTATLADYNPVKELSDARRAAYLFADLPTEIIYFIAELTPKERLAAVANCQMVDSYYERFRSRVADFASFWTPDNLERLNAYGRSPLNAFQFEAEHRTINGRPLVILRHEREEMRVIPGARLNNLERTWVSFTYKKV